MGFVKEFKNFSKKKCLDKDKYFFNCLIKGKLEIGGKDGLLILRKEYF